MPLNVKNAAKPHRYIKSELKSHKIYWDKEYVVRWAYMKVLREYSTIKQFYPEINPYVEVYKFRDNTYALYSESMDGMGDPWMYVIDGPKKALVIDTAFGVGDLKGLVKKLVGDKEIIVANTHHHYDHAYGNAQFEKVYCHKDEVYCMKKTMNPHIWDYLTDDRNQPIYTYFDPKDIIEYHDYDLVPLDDNETIDLGDGYLVECIPLRGHTAGQAGYLDQQTGCLFTGDTTSASEAKPGEPHPENCTVERLRDDFQKIVDRIDEVSGIFPGHGMVDMTPSYLQYTLDTCNQILENPKNYDRVNKIKPAGLTIEMYSKNIYQGTDIKYGLDNVYYPKNK